MANLAEAWAPAGGRSGPSVVSAMTAELLALRPGKPLALDATNTPGAVARISADVTVLDRASRNVMTLLDRYRRLEAHVRQLDSWSAAQIEAAESAAAHARSMTAAAEAKLEALQGAYDAMRKRAEAAEQTIGRDSRTLETLQNRIIAAFGFGAEPHGGPASAALA